MALSDPLMLTILVLALPVLALNAGVWWAARKAEGPVAPAWAPPRQGAAEVRLRTAPGLRAGLVAASAGLAGALLLLHDGGQLRMDGGAVPWPELVLLAALVWHTAAMWTWELRFDAVGLSAPVLIFGRRARLWRSLVEMTEAGPLTIRLHFADGSVIAVPKQVVGAAALRQMANHWLCRAQEPPDARTARS